MAERKIKALLVAEDRASAVIGRVGSAFTALGSVAAAVGVYQIGRLLVRGLQESVTAAAAAETATNALAQSIRLSGQDVSTTLPRLTALADELQQVTGESDEAIQSGLGLLTALGRLRGEGLERAARAALDFATKTGSIETAFDLVAKAAAGNFATLSRYGIKVDETASQTEKLNQALTGIERAFGGQAAARMETFAGQTALLGENFENLQEKLGAAVTSSPAVQAALQGLNDIIRELTAALGTDTGQAAIKAATVALANLGVAAAEAGRIAANATFFYKGLFDALVNLDSASPLDTLSEAFEGMQKFHNEAQTGIDRLKELRDEIAKAPVSLEVIGAEELAIFGDPFAGVSTSAAGATSSIAGLRTEVEGLAGDFERVTDAAEATVGHFFALGEGEGLQNFIDGWDAAAEAAEPLAGNIGAMSTQVASIGDTLQFTFEDQAVAAVDTFAGALEAAFNGADVKIGKVLRSMLAQMTAAIVRALILRAIFAAITGGASEATGLGGSIAGGTGWAGAGGSAIMLTAGGRGRISPDIAPAGDLGSLGGGSPIYITINAQGAWFPSTDAPEALQRSLVRAIEGARDRGIGRASRAA